MRQEIQKSLFDEKGCFNPERFKEECMNDTFVDCVRSGISSALDKVTSANLHIRQRVKSDSMHDIAFYEIQDFVSSSYLFDRISFHSDLSGNKRLWFSYKGYSFILKKAESDGNKSNIGEIINMQKADCHVITIEYAINDVWDKVTAISFQYIRNKFSEMVCYVPMTNNHRMFVDDEFSIAKDIKPAKATLKIVARKTE